ncbi:hypothetical protein SAMN03159512_04705 [Pseudomonas sp. NFR09]|uniref:hypothetical protein n=1 Tax=Pseudomonas sp. NFR09 TaxID=1566249 RepID=UPI0008B5BFB6|nr:hypothetical protein [Pseudomonas sp. NFR09]SEU03885.1 hypothetical protein SAMN03159512_04705 [Pseudomonas sp. NFR09]
MVDLDIKALVDFAKKNFISVLIAFVVYGGLATHLWNWGQKLSDQERALFKDRQAFSDEQVEFERRKSESSIGFVTRDKDLELRENLLKRELSDKDKALAEIALKERRILEAEEQLKVEQRLVSKDQLAKAAEDRMQALMAEFASLGVSLDMNPHCETGEVSRRYYAAQAKFSEILSLAKSHFLTGKYRDFITTNQQKRHFIGC